MRRTSVLLLLIVLISPFQLKAQNESANSESLDNFSVGLGGGLDYGGFGANVLFYPQANIGIFGGVGYALAGAGYNAGFKVRLINNQKPPKIHMNLLAMYGYNAAIAVTNEPDLNKLFYGFTAGVGMDLRINPQKIGYLSLAVLVPIRSPEVEDYMDELETDHGVEFASDLIPIAVSVGYRFILSRR